MGSIDILRKVTTIDKPFFVYDSKSKTIIDDLGDTDHGILYNSIENMPTEFPFDASMFFGKTLYKFIIPILKSDHT